MFSRIGLHLASRQFSRSRFYSSTKPRQMTSQEANFAYATLVCCVSGGICATNSSPDYEKSFAYIMTKMCLLFTIGFIGAPVLIPYSIGNVVYHETRNLIEK